MPGILSFLKERWQTAGEVKKTVASNVVWRVLATGINKVVRLFVILYAANRLGSTGFGLYSYTVSIATLAFVLSDCGINLLLTRDYPIAKTDLERERLVRTSFVLRLIIGLTSTAVIPILLLVIGDFSLTPLALAFAATVLVGNVRDISVSIFLAVQKARFEFNVYLIETFTVALVCIFVFRPSPSPFTLLLVYGLGSLVSASYALFVSNTITPLFLRKRFDWALTKERLFKGLPLSFFGVATYLFFSADQLILKHFWGLHEVGVYNVGTRIVLAVAIVPGLLNALILPHLSRHGSNLAQIKKIIMYCLAFLVGCATLFCMAVFAIGPFLVRHYFTSDFWPIIPLLGPLSIMAIPLFAVSLFDYVLISYDLQKQDFYLTLFAGVINVVINITLVPLYGIAGAVAASVASQFINACLTGIYMVFAIKKRAITPLIVT